MFVCFSDSEMMLPSFFRELFLYIHTQKPVCSRTQVHTYVCLYTPHTHTYVCTHSGCTYARTHAFNTKLLQHAQYPCCSTCALQHNICAATLVLLQHVQDPCCNTYALQHAIAVASATRYCSTCNCLVATRCS